MLELINYIRSLNEEEKLFLLDFLRPIQADMLLAIEEHELSLLEEKQENYS